MTMVVIHARFERFLTPYASCDTSAHLLGVFDQENSKKCKTCRKPKQLGMVPWIGHTRHEIFLGHFKHVGKRRALRRSHLAYSNTSVDHGLSFSFSIFCSASNITLKKDSGFPFQPGWFFLRFLHGFLYYFVFLFFYWFWKKFIKKSK